MSERSFLNEIRSMISLGDWDSSDVSLIDSPMATSATPYNIMGTLLNGGRMCVYKDLVRVLTYAQRLAQLIGMVPQMFAVLFKSYEQELAQRGQGAEIELRREFRYHRLGWRVGALNCGGATPMPPCSAVVKVYLRGSFMPMTENYASDRGWTNHVFMGSARV